jgi:hypothetical protein
MEHKEAYLHQYSELAFVLGAVHWGLTKWVAQHLEFAEFRSGLAFTQYESFLESAFLIAGINFAAHMSLPPAVNEATRSVDPIVISLAGFRFVFNTFAEGLKTTFPPLASKVKERYENKQNNAMPKIIGEIWSSRRMKIMRNYLIPSMLHNLENFIKDLAIKPHWPEFKIKLIFALRIFEKWQLKLLSNIPAAPVAAKVGYGIPEVISVNVAKLIGNPTFMRKLSNLRRDIEALQASEPPELQTNRDIIPLRKPEAEATNAKENVEEEKKVNISEENSVKATEKRDVREVYKGLRANKTTNLSPSFFNKSLLKERSQKSNNLMYPPRTPPNFGTG